MTTIAAKDEHGTAPAEPACASPVSDTTVLDLAARADLGWRVLGWVGTALLVVALGTIAVVWLPPAFGNMDWEFGTIADSFTVMPLLVMGLGGTLAAAVARRRARMLLALGVLFVLLVVWLLVAGVLFSTTAVVAWQRAVETPGITAVGVKRVIARTLWYGLIGFLGCCLAASYSLKTFVASSRRHRA